jgi:hypothetical protein
MNIPYLVYSVSTGMILRTGDAPPSMVSIQAQPGERVMQGLANQGTQYVQVAENQDDDVLADKEAIPYTVSASTIAADGLEACVVGNLPIPCSWRLSGPLMASGVELDGDLGITTDEPGMYTLELTGPIQYLSVIITITAV